MARRMAGLRIPCHVGIATRQTDRPVGIGLDAGQTSAAIGLQCTGSAHRQLAHRHTALRGADAPFTAGIDAKDIAGPWRAYAHPNHAGERRVARDTRRSTPPSGIVQRTEAPTGALDAAGARHAVVLEGTGAVLARSPLPSTASSLRRWIARASGRTTSIQHIAVPRSRGAKHGGPFEGLIPHPPLQLNHINHTHNQQYIRVERQHRQPLEIRIIARSQELVCDREARLVQERVARYDGRRARRK